MSFSKLLRLAFLGFGVIILAVGVLLFVRLTRTSSEIAIPAPAESAAVTENFFTGVDRITVNEENVQDAIEKIARPEAYSRYITVENFWEGGSSVDDFNVSVRDGVTAIRTHFGGTMKNVIQTDEYTYIWYAGDSTAFVRKNSDIVHADKYQKINAYEDILKLRKPQILAAAFINDTNGPGIFVKYESSTFGYITDVIISIELGLVTSVEQYDGDTLIYRMSSESCNLETPGEAGFILPDGVNTLE